MPNKELPAPNNQQIVRFLVFFRQHPHFTTLLAVLAVALFMRTYRLDREAAWYDEISTLQFLNGMPLSDFLRNCEDLNPVPPVYLITQYYWARYVSAAVVHQRVLSVIFGMASLVALYGVTRALAGPRAALFATLWMTLMPWHLYHSQEIRFYAMVTLLGLVSVWIFVRVVETGSWAALALLCAINWLAAWTHPLCVFLFGVQGLFLLLYRRQFAGLIATFAAVHVALALSLYQFMSGVDWTRVSELARWIPPPKLIGPGPGFTTYLRVAGGYPHPVAVYPFNGLGYALYPAYPVLGLTLLCAVIAGACYGIWKLKNLPPAASGGVRTAPLRGVEKIILLVLWFVIPPICAFIISRLWRPVFLDRYLSYAMPPLYILVGVALASLRWRAGVAAAFSAPLLIYLAFYFPGPQRVPYDEMVRIIRENGSRDPVIYSPLDFVAPAVRLYWRGAEPPIFSPPEYNQLLEGKIAPPADCWFICPPMQLEEITRFLKTHGETYRVWEFPGVRPAVMVHWVPKNPGGSAEIAGTPQNDG
jgi:mannosyltransferase